MLVQTSMAHAFSNVRISGKTLMKSTEDHLKKISNMYDNIERALKVKVGTIKVHDRISLSYNTFKKLREQEMLPAHMM